MDNYHTLNQLQDELKEKYPKLTIRRDGHVPGEYLMIDEGDKSIAELSISNRDFTILLRLSNSKPKQFPTFEKAKASLLEWLKNHMRYSDYL